MPLSQVVAPVRSSGKDASLWKLEWTYSDTSGTVALDTAQSDQHPNVPVTVVKAATGRTTVNFPKCKRAWVIGAPAVEPVTIGTAANNVRAVAKSVSATGGTLEIQFVAANGGSAPIDPPEAGTRVRLTLLLERP